MIVVIAIEEVDDKGACRTGEQISTPTSLVSEPSSDPHRCPRPTMGVAARDNGVATDKAPCAEDEGGHSSVNGATELSTE